MSTAQAEATLLTEFADFLATSPSPASIVAWRPSPGVQNRLGEMLYRQNAGTLGPYEKQEIENWIQAESMLRLLKARLQLALAGKKQ